MLSNRIALLVVTGLAPAIWGTTYLVTTEFLPPDRPLLTAVVRALPAGLALMLVTRRLPHREWGRTLVLGGLNIGLFFALLFIGAYRLPGGVAATLGAVQPLLVGVLATRLLGQRLTLRTVLAGAAGVAGVGLLVLRADARLDTVGVLAALGGAAAMATGVVLTKRWNSAAPLLAATGWQLVAGGLLLAPVALVVEGPPPALTGANVGGYLYLSVVGTALAYVLLFGGIRALPASDVAFLGLLSPVVATAAGRLLLDQGFTVGQAIGAAVVLGALAFGQGRVRRPAVAGGVGGPAGVLRLHEVAPGVGRAGVQVGEAVVARQLPARQ